MGLEWVPRDDALKNHQVFGDEHFGTEAPCTMFEKKPLVNPGTGEKIDGLYTAWITPNNPAQLNSYTTEMVQGVIAGMHKASMDRSVVATIFTPSATESGTTIRITSRRGEFFPTIAGCVKAATGAGSDDTLILQSTASVDRPPRAAVDHPPK